MKLYYTLYCMYYTCLATMLQKIKTHLTLYERVIPNMLAKSCLLLLFWDLLTDRRFTIHSPFSSVLVPTNKISGALAEKCSTIFTGESLTLSRLQWV